MHTNTLVELKKSVFSTFVLVLLLTVVLMAFVKPVVAEETIYIKLDGSVEGTDKIQREGNVYTFTDNIVNQSIVVERDNIVIDGAEYTLRGIGSGRGIDLSRRSNVTVKNVTIRRFDDGIYLSYSFRNTLSGNTLTNNTRGIWIYASSNSNISRNYETNNKVGSWLKDSSNNNISRNKIENNYYYGIRFEGSCSNNVVSRNDVVNNQYFGIWLYKSSNNKFYHNHFINNTHQVYSYDSTNTWDNGLEGNYWSDYEERYPNATEIDGLGIWDTPYVIDENDQDNYPLVPEFPAWTSTFVILTMLTVSIVIYKRRLLKTPIH